MPDLLDCLMPACHQASAVTTPAVAGMTFPDVIVEPPGLVAALSAHRAVAGLVDGRGGWSEADGVELLGRYRLCGHRGHADEESAK
jgi:hypothetical protein